MYKSIRLLLSSCLLLTGTGQAQTIYTWTDQHGVVHFSDRPYDAAAQPLSIPENPPPHAQPAEPSGIQSAPKQHTAVPNTLQIDLQQPSHEQTIRDNLGQISVKVALNRPLSDQEQLQLVLDDQPFGAPGTKTVWQLNNIERGSHTFLIQALVSGKVIASSSKVTVYLHRASLN